MINVQQIPVQCEWRNCTQCFEDHSDYLTILLDTDVSPLIQSVSVCVCNDACKYILWQKGITLCVCMCLCVCVCVCGVCVCKDTCVHGRALISSFTTYKIACGLCLKWYHLLTPIFSIVIFCIGLVLHVVCC